MPNPLFLRPELLKETQWAEKYNSLIYRDNQPLSRGLSRKLNQLMAKVVNSLVKKTLKLVQNLHLLN
jgi:hypothetical protein